MKQWEIWKGKPEGFQADHWFVILSGEERCQNAQLLQVNGLVCFSLRGGPSRKDVVLDQADGFQAPTCCACDFFHPLKKSSLHSSLGTVSWERQQAIKAKLKDVLRLGG
jgi:hypothetical protein